MKATKSKKKTRATKAKAPKKRAAKKRVRLKTADDGGGMGPPH